MKPLDPRLLRYAKAVRGYLLACVGLGVLAALLIVAQAGLLATAITEAFGGVFDGSTLALLAVVIAARSAVVWAQEVAAQRSSAAAKAQLRSALFGQLARLGPLWLNGERTGELTNLAVRGLDALDSYFAKYLPQLVLSAAVPVVVLARVLPADRVAGVTIALTLPLIPLFLALIGRTTQQRNTDQFRQLGRLSHHFLELVAGLPTLKAFGRAKSQARVIGELSQSQRQVTMRTLRWAFVSSLALELIATLSVALVAVGIGLRVVSGALDLRTALLLLILAPEAYLPLRQVGAHFHASAEGIAASEQVFAVLETQPRLPGGDQPPPAARRSTIEFRDVTVRYPDAAEPALKSFSLRIAPGEVVALTGPSGGGKSTALAALLGFIELEHGAILIDSQDLSKLDITAWRRQIAWVPQRPHLFAGTVAENARLSRPEASDRDLRRALRRAGLTDLPLGAQTRVGDAGSGLSAGQRQRVGLARAMLSGADLMLLDEPTAHLDEATEHGIADTIRSLGRAHTVVLVAHRPALLAVADRVIHIDSRAEASVAGARTGSSGVPDEGAPVDAVRTRR